MNTGLTFSCAIYVIKRLFCSLKEIKPFSELTQILLEYTLEKRLIGGTGDQ